MTILGTQLQKGSRAKITLRRKLKTKQEERKRKAATNKEKNGRITNGLPQPFEKQTSHFY